jgi:HPt (histidine-containing phosphotransfer) domain-containing protein
VTGAAASLTADVKDAAQSLRRAAAGQATEFASDVGHELKQAAAQQKTRGVDALKGFAHAIESAAGELESQSPQWHATSERRQRASRASPITCAIAAWTS